MDAQDDKTIEVPMGNTKEDIKAREASIINCDRGIKKEIDRLAHSKGHHQILDVYGLFPY